MKNIKIVKKRILKYSKNMIFVFCLSFLIFNFSLLTVLAEGVKEPNVAGAFYPADKDSLGELIQKYMASASDVKPVPGALVLIVPHAGYVYSGPVAAYGYKAIEGKSFDTVIILAASHFFPYSGVSIYARGYFRTPLGDLEVDRTLAEALIKLNPGLLFDGPQYFQQEHSIEVELPFLQESLKKGFKILPMLVGQISYQASQDIARALAELIKDKSVLVVVSTDLSHYRTYDEALDYDAQTIDYIKKFDAQGLWDAVEPTGWNVCGVRPVAIGMNLAQLEGATKISLLKYANSGDTAGDKSRVVGYASVLFSKESKKTENTIMQDRKDTMLTKDDKKRLLEIARSTLEAFVKGEKVPVFNEKSPGLNLKNGAFVTLTRHGSLRGCIGVFASRDVLYKTIVEMAISASSQDYRFSPVEPRELNDIEIEISVLSEPQEISDWRKIRLGVDGVIIRKGFSSGVFLPQVATETGWDLETFLGELCSQKAGLPRECYKDPGAKILTFQADVFNEKEVKGW